jgi:hypothetical protein
MLSLVFMISYAPMALASGVFSEDSDPVFAAVTDEVGLEEDVEPSGELTPGRMALYESAYMYKAGKGAWTSMDLGLHRLDYAINDNFQFGVTMAVPIGFLGVVPELKIGGKLADGVHGSVTVRAAMLLLPGALPIFGYGGHAALTFGSPDLHVTAGVHAYGMSALGMTEPVAWMVHPTLGGVARVSDFAVLHLDVGPFVTGDELAQALCGSSCAGEGAVNADVWLIKYGVRFHGDAWFGDVSFLIPTHESWRELASYLPLGLPTMTLGYAF